MTLGRFSILVTVILVAVPFAVTLTSGQPALILWLLLAPVPSYLVYGRYSDYSDWTLRDALDRFQGEDPVHAALDDALRPPLPTPGHAEDDGSYFVPDCPPLR